jgi:hypothetical protein
MRIKNGEDAALSGKLVFGRFTDIFPSSCFSRPFQS